jgi:hypothetical protein
LALLIFERRAAPLTPLRCFSATRRAAFRLSGI